MFDILQGLSKHDLLQVGLVGHTKDAGCTFNDVNLFLAPAQSHDPGCYVAIRLLFEASYEFGKLFIHFYSLCENP